MFFKELIVFSIMINNRTYTLKNIENEKKYVKTKKIRVFDDTDINKVGIVDFRFILKRSNAMKVLGNKFITIEKEINQKIKQKQIYLKNKEEQIKKNKNKLSVSEYNKRIKLFKDEVFQIQKKYKDERSSLNKSFQKIQKDLKDLLAQIIKDISIKKNINVVLLKENVFLFNDPKIDFTLEVLELFNKRTRSMKIIITSSN